MALIRKRLMRHVRPDLVVAGPKYEARHDDGNEGQLLHPGKTARGSDHDSEDETSSSSEKLQSSSDDDVIDARGSPVVSLRSSTTNASKGTLQIFVCVLC